MPYHPIKIASAMSSETTIPYFSFTLATERIFSSLRFFPHVPAYFLHTFGETTSYLIPCSTNCTWIKPNSIANTL